MVRFNDDDDDSCATANINAGLPALYMCITVPMGFFLNGQWHYGNDELLAWIVAGFCNDVSMINAGAG